MLLRIGLLGKAVRYYETFNTSYKDAWRYIKKALPEHIPNGHAKHVLGHTSTSHFMMKKGDLLVLQ